MAFSVVTCFSKKYLVAEGVSTAVHTCMPVDPVPIGGVENAVMIAKSDLVPKDSNLQLVYGSFAELEEACV